MDRVITRIGVGLAHDTVRVVAVRHGRIVWAAEAPVASAADLPTALESLFALARLPRFPRPILSAAIGPHASYVKIVSGLPSVDPATLAAIVRESTGSFFLKNGVPLLTTSVHPLSEGTALAATIEEPCVAAVRVACADRGWRLGFIAPTPVLLEEALEGQSLIWSDGGVVVEVNRSNGLVDSIRTRSFDPAEPPTALLPVPALAHLGPGADRYADAYGAAARRTPPLLALTDRGESWSPAETRRRLRMPVILLLLGALVLALSPLAAHRLRRQAEVRLDTIRPEQRKVIGSTFRQLEQTNAILEEASRFARARLLVTPTLGALASALPDGTVLLAVEIDAERGEVVALAPDPGSVLAAIEKLPGVSAVELVGPVRRESATGREVQRITVRWRWGPG